MYLRSDSTKSSLLSSHLPSSRRNYLVNPLPLRPPRLRRRLNRSKPALHNRARHERQTSLDLGSVLFLHPQTNSNGVGPAEIPNSLGDGEDVLWADVVHVFAELVAVDEELAAVGCRARRSAVGDGVRRSRGCCVCRIY